MRPENYISFFYASIWATFFTALFAISPLFLTHGIDSYITGKVSGLWAWLYVQFSQQWRSSIWNPRCRKSNIPGISRDIRVFLGRQQESVRNDGCHTTSHRCDVSTGSDERKLVTHYSENYRVLSANFRMTAPKLSIFRTEHSLRPLNQHFPQFYSAEIRQFPGSYGLESALPVSVFLTASIEHVTIYCGWINASILTECCFGIHLVLVLLLSTWPRFWC